MSHDEHERARFSNMAESSADDWMVIGASFVSFRPHSSPIAC